MHPAPKWRVSLQAALVWRTWAHESVVFNPRSGDTHLLNLVEREGLSSLEAAPLDADELTTELAHRLEIEPDDQLRRYAQNLIALLADLGLVETAGS